MCHSDTFEGKVNTQLDLTPYAKVNFIWTVDLNWDKVSWRKYWELFHDLIV